MHPISMIAIGAAAVVAIAWLAVSFMRPGANRRRIEWLGATALYVALLSLFVNLVRRSIASDNEVGIFAFGFLATTFSIGLVIASFKTIAALRNSSAAKGDGATH